MIALGRLTKTFQNRVPFRDCRLTQLSAGVRSSSGCCCGVALDADIGLVNREVSVHCIAIEVHSGTRKTNGGKKRRDDDGLANLHRASRGVVLVVAPASPGGMKPGGPGLAGGSRERLKDFPSQTIV